MVVSRIRQLSAALRLHRRRSAQKEDDPAIESPPAPLGLFKPVKGILLGLKKGLQGPGKQVTDVVDVQKNRIGEDEQQVHGGEALAFADAGGGQMALDMQLGKQIFHPGVQFAGKLFQVLFGFGLERERSFCYARGEAFSVGYDN